MIIVLLILFLAVAGVVGFFVMREINKNKKLLNGEFNTEQIETAQEFLPFEDIRDNMILLGNHHYRMIVEASSTNYDLRTDTEKGLIEMTFQRFLNSLTFPVTFYVQTKYVDNRLMLEELNNEIQTALGDFPQLENYATMYFDEMNKLNQYVGNNKQKKKYVIVPFDEALSMTIPEHDKYEYSYKELTNRANMMVDGLSSIGVTAKVLNKKELIELLYTTYHKDESGIPDFIESDFLSMIVNGHNTEEAVSDEGRIDWILYEAQMRMQTELLAANVSQDVMDKAEAAFKKLSDTRQELDAFYEEVYAENDNNQ